MSLSRRCTCLSLLLLLLTSSVYAEQAGGNGVVSDGEDPGIDFEIDVDEADQLLEKLRRKANITYEEGMHFVATSNTDLLPGKPERRGRRKVRSTSAMLRRTDAFGLYFKGGVGLSIDRERRRSDDPDDRPRVEVIRGTTAPFNTYRAKVLTVDHGLISTVIEAYNHHLNLRLRPDDIWITILTQLSAYVNGQGRAEKLRSKLVDHDGKKQLTVTSPEAGSIWTVDFGVMTRLMLDQIAANIKDETMREWFLPGFSTSTENDDICASAAAMCTMQEYFEYLFEILCGIPEVTLLGEVADWEILRSKVEGLMEFELEDDDSLPTWVGLLRRICDNFVESAKNGSENNLLFWDTVAHRTEGGSSEPYLSGWITAFSYFDSEGAVVTPPTDTFEDGSPLWNMATVTAGFLIDTSDKYKDNQDEYSSWPVISTNNIASNVISCPVQIDDNGTPYDARLYVGQMALDYLRTSRRMKDRSTAIAAYKRGNLRMVQGRNDWALVIAKPEGGDGQEGEGESGADEDQGE